ncbi:hypothetical protein DFH28DRAFT_840629, partial [Melampsora americana]
MEFRVDKGTKSYLPQFRDHWKELAARQFSEKTEAAKKILLEQQEERNRRVASRALLATQLTSKEIKEKLWMNDIDDEEIEIQDSFKTIGTNIPSPSTKEDLISTIMFNKISTQ